MRSRDVMGKEELAWLCTCDDIDRPEHVNIKNTEYSKYVFIWYDLYYLSDNQVESEN